jgi:hypothetical protein
MPKAASRRAAGKQAIRSAVGLQHRTGQQRLTRGLCNLTSRIVGREIIHGRRLSPRSDRDPAADRRAVAASRADLYLAAHGLEPIGHAAKASAVA